MHVAVRHRYRTVTRDPSQRPNITPRCAQPRQKRVAQRVENEWARENYRIGDFPQDVVDGNVMDRLRRRYRMATTKPKDYATGAGY